MAIEDILPPFWNRIPKLFLYPLRINPMMLMLVLSFILSIASGKGLWGIAASLLAWGVLLKYSHAALQHTAGGKINTAPPINVRTVSDEFDMVFKQMFLYVVIGVGFVQATRLLGIGAGLIFLLFAFLSIPAIIIVLVASRSITAALNPVVFVGMAWRIGWAYLLMYLFLMLLGTAPTVLVKLVVAYLPQGLHLFLLSMIQAYYMILSYHLMGYVIYQYHEEIGYEVDFEDEEITSEGKGELDPDEAVLDKVGMLISDGRLEDAIFLIKSETKGKEMSVELAGRYFKLLKMREKTPELNRFGNRYLEILHKADRKKLFCEVFKELTEDPGASITPPMYFKAAGCLKESGEFKGALNVYNAFVKSNAGSPLTPKAYFLAAGIINEKLGNPDRTRRILEGLLKKYPDHEIIPHVKKYLGRMKA